MNEKFEREHARIVHNLRSQGWSREDAIYEADAKISRWMEKDEAAREEVEKVKRDDHR